MNRILCYYWAACTLSLVAFSTHSALGAEPTPGKQVEMSFKASDGAEVPYLLYLPEAYESAANPLPLVLFLHGRGESNGPLSIVAAWGPPQMAARGDKLPYILISPQCPRDDSWRSPTQQKRVSELLDTTVKGFKVDTQRLILTGLSMGGAGSWRMSADNPDKFAAVVPICGSVTIEDAPKLKDIPLWAWVGDRDGVYEANVKMQAAIEQAGGQSSRLTVLEHIGHNSWSAAYASPDLTAWMLKQKR